MLIRYIKKLSQIGALIYAWIHIFLRQKVKSESQDVLIILGGHQGDALMYAQAIEKLIIYFASQGRKVYLCCAKPSYQMLKIIIETSKVQYLDIGIDRFVELSTFSQVKKILTKVKQYYFDKIIVIHGRQMIMHYIAAYTYGNEKIALIHESKSNKFNKRIRRIIYQYYSNIIMPGDKHLTESIKMLLKELGLPPYEISITPIPTQIDGYQYFKKPYITIAVDSMSPHRRWPTERFMVLIEELLKRYSYHICLTGQNVSNEDLNLYEKAFGTNARVHSFINQTSFLEWIELLRGSSFHISVDSGSIHVAASVGTVAFCLTGVWDGQRIMPYKTEGKREITEIPIPVYRKDVNVQELVCYECAAIAYMGFGNEECHKQCKMGQPCVCLTKIQVEDVLAMVRQYFDNSAD